jgi:microcystin-dependent protein
MSDPFLGEIKIVAFGFAPKNWTFCNGQTLPINQNQALFSLLGTNFGGNGQTTFGLPNLQGRVPMHANGGNPGIVGGETAHTLVNAEMPTHNHIVNVDATTAATSNTNTASTSTVLSQTIGTPASGSNFPVNLYGTSAPTTTLTPATIGPGGGSQAHDNMQPYLVLNFIIALVGIYPSRN